MTEAFLFKHALFEFARPKRVVVWILVAIALFGISRLFISVTDVAKPETYTQLSASLVFRLLALASAIFTTAIISAEVEQKTIVYLLTRPISRWKLLLARYLASVLVVTLIGWISAFFVSFAVYGMSENPYLLKDLWAILLGAFAYGGLFTLISLLFNRAMIICLLYAFGWETSVPNMPGDLYYLSIFSHLQAIVEHPSNSTENGILDLAAGQMQANLITSSLAYPVLFFLTAATVGLSLWWFSHFEYVPREDAE